MSAYFFILSKTFHPEYLSIFIFGTIQTASKRFFRLRLFRSWTNNFINHLSCVKAFSHFCSSILFSQEIRNISSKLHGLSVMRCTTQVQYSSEPADRNTPDEFHAEQSVEILYKKYLRTF